MRRLVYTEASRRGLALLALLLATLVFGLPLLMLVLASVAGQWNGVLPSQFTLEHLRSAVVGSQSVALWHSLANASMCSGWRKQRKAKRPPCP